MATVTPTRTATGTRDQTKEPDWLEQRKRYALNMMVGAPCRNCNGMTFWLYRRKSDGEEVWYCYPCFPPKRASSILGMMIGGVYMKQTLARKYYRNSISDGQLVAVDTGSGPFFRSSFVGQQPSFLKRSQRF